MKKCDGWIKNQNQNHNRIQLFLNATIEIEIEIPKRGFSASDKMTVLTLSMIFFMHDVTWAYTWALGKSLMKIAYYADKN